MYGKVEVVGKDASGCSFRFPDPRALFRYIPPWESEKCTYYVENQPSATEVARLLRHGFLEAGNTLFTDDKGEWVQVIP